MERPFIAHWREDKNNGAVKITTRDGKIVSAEIQLIQNHLKNTAYLAEKFADEFGAGTYAKQIGLAHDIGKYSEAFQMRIWNNAPKTDHSTAGAKEEVIINKNAMGYVAAYCISGHHAGLLNGGSLSDTAETVQSLKARLNKHINEDYERYKDDIELSKLETHPKIKRITTSGKNNGFFSLAFWTRMIFSCLVDADYLDTELFANYGKTARYSGEDFQQLIMKLNQYFENKGWLKGAEGINKIRSEILNNCIERGRKSDTGIFTLTVPTGGGKTVASLAFAMNHVLTNKKRRIIYVIPYCSIIDQTVSIFSEILGTSNVLAHYSAIDFNEKTTDGSERYSKILATENWDKPVIVTTAVQFFESLFANKTSKCRKLHNITNSVIIFDEAQTLPQPYLKPCLAAIMELVINYNCSSVFCTATQPALNRFIENLYIDKIKKQIEIHEICKDTEKLYHALRRVTYEKIGALNNEELVEKLSEYKQVLCIVTTRKQAADVYQLMEGMGNFHLSKCMTSKHIRQTLEKVREQLRKNVTCRVIATSLVEAGVDLDFPVVFRAEAGLDSIIQAGGRCNREGKSLAEKSKVFIFKAEKKYISHLPPAIQRQIAVMNMVTDKAANFAGTAVITKYFNVLYNNLSGNSPATSDGLDIKHIIEDFEDSQKFSFPFADVADKFTIIDNKTISILVPSDKISRDIAEKLQNKYEQITTEEFRIIGNYCVNIYPNIAKKIKNAVNMISEDFGILVIESLYDDNTGLKFEDEGGFGIFA